MSEQTVKVLFFARLREALPEPQVQLAWPKTATVADLRAALRARGADWQALTSDLLVAVNQEMASSTAPVQPGDEVAFFPPVTGG
ncbi:MAG: molybdopterin converting factor subunit 1 [Natronospirillum sp.]|uniref:molybdopterin converting factor subunit 1 n=1 Tax=Natronospirillum sp. TaxID=2812955 RepID=UPI0025E0FCDC|nr:molybdopterin converting factor subunit 1 [Natronospirillum sp.]MCH8551089.1 molybdopterin converting factor subunit 1 [Natronospirillum sp.]